MLHKNTIYTITIDCVPGSRYVFQPVNNGIQARNITFGDILSVTRSNQTFNMTASSPETTASFDGNGSTVNIFLPGRPGTSTQRDRGRRRTIYYLYISPTTDISWGENLLLGKYISHPFEKKSATITLLLPFSINPETLYDIMAIDGEGRIFSRTSQKIETRIEITSLDRDWGRTR